MSHLFFYMDGNSFYCEKGPDTYQVGEVLNSMVDMFSLDTCEEINGKTDLLQEDLEQAINWAVDAGYLVQY